MQKVNMILKQLWLHFMRNYIRLGLFFYYKKIKLVNIESVPKTGAVMFLGNHQSALMDALFIACRSGRFTYFLTRASVFQNVIIEKILRSLLMIPVYRVRDGWSKISKNNAIFKECGKLLGQNNALSLFPEGNHNIKRMVRPLSKGFTRIIHEALDQYPDLELNLVPVGFNYKHADKFGDSVSLYFGDPITIKSEDTANKTESVVELKEVVYNNFCQLTTNIPVENYEVTLQKLEHLNVDFLNPVAVNTCIASNFKNCESSKSIDVSIVKKFFKFWLILALIIPYLVWKFKVQTKIKDIEFMATFRFAIAITLVPIFVLILTLILLVFISFKLALMYFISVILLALLAVKL
jgi:1-acyl-sn-glycerol-3-phosphate acyltransferase